MEEREEKTGDGALENVGCSERTSVAERGTTERSRTSVAAREQMLEWLGVPRGALCLRRGTAAPLSALGLGGLCRHNYGHNGP